MSTFLFDKIIFGPVKSRRLGVSLGINLLPLESKVCNFNCIYCECGWNQVSTKNERLLPSRETVYTSLKAKLQEMKLNNEIPDVITFAGNGEPTIHPAFAEIIEDTLALRNEFFPGALVSVLSNATMLHQKGVITALNKVDQNILKLDSAIESTIIKLNQPVGKFAISNVIENLKQFEGKLIIQTLFTRGIYQDQKVDNTTEEELKAWGHAITEIHPQKVMIYSIDRSTPLQGLEKISGETLKKIAARISALGIEVQVTT